VINKLNKIFIAGHTGMVGSAILRNLKKNGYENIVTKSRVDLDLKNEFQVEQFFKENKPDIVILAAAKVGGIQANINAPAEFLFDNLTIQNNVIHQSYCHGVKKFFFLGSSCIYPKECPQPMSEEHLLSGSLEPTNEGYALAKIAGIKLVETYHQQYGFDSLSLIPCNLYGTNDHFDLKNSHVLSALVRRFSDAVEVNSSEITLWGTGKARREFLHVDDLASAVKFFLENPTQHRRINIGSGEDISIYDLAYKVAKARGYRGTINWDSSKPEGMLRKCLDISKQTSEGYSPLITLDQGIAQTISEYKELKRKGKIK